ADVDVYFFGKVEETKGDARVNFEIVKRISDRNFQVFPMLNLHEFDELNWQLNSKVWNKEIIVDALFGTGLIRPLDDNLSGFIKVLNGQHGKRDLSVSIDLPSGLNADSNELQGVAFEADITVTFTAPKLANIFPPASNYNGSLHIAKIGTPDENFGLNDFIDEMEGNLFISDKDDISDWLISTRFNTSSYKNKRGHALVVGGAKNYAGAAILAGNAAIVSGVGLVTVAAPESVHNAIASRMLPEVMTRSVAETGNGAIAYEAAGEILEFIEGKIDAVAVGSGMSSSEESTRKFVREFVEKRKTPIVIDADGLNSLAPFDLTGSVELPLILTPHEGEFLKLLGTKDKEAIKDRVKAVRDFAEKHHVILVLKGERSLIAAPDGRVVVNPTGNSGLGKAGNGDTLTGIIVGFVAQAVQMKIDVFETVVAAVYIAGTAGDIAAAKYGKRLMLATDVRECLQDAFREIENQS
ncbi:MAG: NAD(P)H-hydrate dehydratase, partial [Acidobacteriota bacterium]|nr:NAD(P)H-hydrate dehydratase [Acidobacteriota bacterium]